MTSLLPFSLLPPASTQPRNDSICNMLLFVHIRAVTCEIWCRLFCKHLHFFWQNFALRWILSVDILLRTQSIKERWLQSTKVCVLISKAIYPIVRECRAEPRCCPSSRDHPWHSLVSTWRGRAVWPGPAALHPPVLGADHAGVVGVVVQSPLVQQPAVKISFAALHLLIYVCKINMFEIHCIRYKYLWYVNRDLSS